MNVGNDTTTGDGGLDKGVELLISSDGELQMSGRDTLHLQVLRGVACQLQYLRGIHRLQLRGPSPLF